MNMDLFNPVWSSQRYGLKLVFSHEEIILKPTHITSQIECFVQVVHIKIVDFP